MNSAPNLTFVYSLILGLTSYFICYRLGIKYLTTDDYLFSGNNTVLGTLSIVGTVVSASVLFTVFTVIYMVLGSVTLPTVFIPAVLATVFLIPRTKQLLPDTVTGSAGDRVRFCVREQSRQTGNPRSFAVFTLGYLLTMAACEIAILSNAMDQLYGTDQWAAVTVYAVVLIATAYVYVGGFKGVLITDAIQLVLMSICCFCMFDWHTIPRAADYAITNPVRFNIVEPITFIIGCGLTTFAWFSSAPEIWQRLITLGKHSERKRSTIAMIPFVFLILLVPLLLIVSTDVGKLSNYSWNQAYLLWKSLLTENGTPFAVCFLVFLITAFFTTIDTFIITSGQHLSLVVNECGDNGFCQYIRRNLRSVMTLFAGIILAVGIQLDSDATMLIGVYGGCQVIPLFLMIYIMPSNLVTSVKRKLPDTVFVSGFLGSLTVLPWFIGTESGSFPPYQLIPIATLLSHCTTIGAYLIYVSATKRRPS